MNSRLLHTAARGARIESSYNLQPWSFDDILWLNPERTAFRYRIHPDDAHLEYGPISSALREAAETGEFPYTLTGLLAKTALDYESMYTYVTYDWHITYLLILAEALADEGM
jgi:hypothetical protein